MPTIKVVLLDLVCGNYVKYHVFVICFTWLKCRICSLMWRQTIVIITVQMNLCLSINHILGQIKNAADKRYASLFGIPLKFYAFLVIKSHLRNSFSSIFNIITHLDYFGCLHCILNRC